MTRSFIGRHLILRLDCSGYLSRKEYQKQIHQYIDRIEPLGFCIFNADAATVNDVLRSVRDYCPYPLLMSIDAEWGSAMRIHGGYEQPHAMALSVASAGDDRLIYDAAVAIGEDLRDYGIDLNFAPVADINSNPDNPIINIRSFSDLPETVAENVIEFAEGLIRTGIIPAVKHFPGHGDTAVDSHSRLPVITKSLTDFKQCELLPFQRSIEADIPVIMTGHIITPNLARELTASPQEAMMPATNSYTLITTLLRERMGFKYVVVSDSIEMQSLYHTGLSQGVVAELFLRAGGDIVLMPPDPILVYEHLASIAENDDGFSQLLLHSGERIEWLNEYRKMIRRNTPFDELDLTQEPSEIIARKALKQFGAIRTKPEHFYIFCSNDAADLAKADYIRSALADAGYPVTQLTFNTTETVIEQNCFFIILDRPRGKLMEEGETVTMTKFIRHIAENVMRADTHLSGAVFLGNPYLERILAPMKPELVIHTYSDSLPSVKAACEVLQKL